MRILIDPSSLHCQNLGDVAMLKVTVRRFQELWPGAEIFVFTERPDLLQLYCPGVIPLDPVGRYSWFSTGMGLSRLAKKFALPALSEIDVQWRRQWPGAAAKLVRSRGGSAEGVSSFRELLESCDLVAVSGAGQITDSFAAHSTLILNTLEAAIEFGIPTVILGQGVGPVDDPALFARASAVLPRVDLIFVRETLTGPALLKRFGVPDHKVVVTGDDAIDLAYNRRPDKIGSALGVNLRVSWYSHIPQEFIEFLREPLQRAAREVGAPFVSVPISRHPEERDQEVSEQLVRGYESILPPVHDVTLIEGLLSEISRCRAVITTSYHGGVFSLSQGIPIVGWLKSSYFASKLKGLANQFGVGCNIVALDEGGDAASRLHSAVLAAWESAPHVRAPLLQAAEKQLKASKAAYARIPELVKQKARVTTGV